MCIRDRCKLTLHIYFFMIISFVYFISYLRCFLNGSVSWSYIFLNFVIYSFILSLHLLFFFDSLLSVNLFICFFISFLFNLLWLFIHLWFFQSLIVVIIFLNRYLIVYTFYFLGDGVSDLICVVALVSCYSIRSHV